MSRSQVWCWVRGLAVALAAGAVPGRSARAQAVVPAWQLADAGPVFYAGPVARGKRIDIARTAMLQRTIELDLDGATISVALAAIAKQSGIEIVYDPDLMPLGARVTLQATKITVASALIAALTDTGLDLEISPTGLLTIVRRKGARTAPAAAQGRELRGHVTEAGIGTPLGQAQVQVKGTTLGTISRDNGEFTITAAPAGALTLVVRRIGYKETEHAVSATENDVQIALEQDVLHLEQTVITGQATAVKKANVANDVAVVDASQLSEVKSPEVLSDLQGKVAGANIQSNGGAPGGGMQMQLRGVSSLIGTSDPLFVVDGVIVSDVVVQPGINPVSQAQGSGIANDQGNGTNRLSDLDPADIASIEILKGASASAIYGSQASNGVVVITTRSGHVGAPEIHIGQKFGFAALSNTIGERNFTSDTAATDAFGALAGNYWKPGLLYPHETELSGNRPLSYATNVSLSGGSDNTQYYVAALNEHDGGIIQNTYYDKQTASVKVNQNLGKRLQVQMGLQFMQTGDGRGFSGNDNVGAAFYDALSTTPSFFNLEPNADGVYPTMPFGTSNVLQTAALFLNEETTDRGIGSFSATWHVVSSQVNALNLLATVGADYFENEGDVYSPPTLQYEIFYGNPGTSVLSTTTNLQTNVNLNLVDILTPSSGAFSSTTSLGVQQNTRRTNQDYTLAKNLTGDLQNVNTGTINEVSQDRERVMDQGIFVQEEFLTLRDRLLLTVGLRADRSTNDAVPTTFFYYPKGSASYRIPLSWSVISSLKLRAAAGEAGNEPLYGQKFGELAPLSYAGISGTQLNILGANGATVASPDLRPERQLEVEGGADLTLFDSVMTIGITGFQKNISQLLLERALPAQSGFANEFFNGGGMRSRGLELEISAAPVQRRSLQWTITSTFTKVGQVITALPVPPFTPSGLKGPGNNGGSFVEQGFDPGGLFGVCRNVTTGVASVCQVGTTTPDFRVGLANDINVHRFHVYFNWDWQKGTQVDNVTQLEYDGEVNSPDEAKIVNCPLQDGGTGAPISLGACRILGRATNTGVYMDDAAFVKLRELTLSYNLPVSFLHLLGRSFSSAAVQVEGRNLVDFTHYPGLDPEVSMTIGNAVDIGRNRDVTPFPPSRTFWFGLNLGI